MQVSNQVSEPIITPIERDTAVLVIPGLDGDPRLLRAATPELFPNRHVVVYDHTHDSAQGGVEGLADRALAALDAELPRGLGAAQRQVYVCGESFGGTVALALARRQPERVRGLILLSTFGWYPPGLGLVCRLGIACWSLLGDRAASRLFHLWRPFSVFGAIGLRCAPDITRTYLDWSVRHLPSYRAKSHLSLDFDARPWLSQVSCPALVLIGTRDPVVPTSAGRALARQLPNAQLFRLPGGHLFHIVRAREAGALIGRWLAEQTLPPGPTPPLAAGASPPGAGILT